MWRWLLLFVLVAGLAGAQQGGGICDGTETPCDPNRPWMRGTIEKSCARPEAVEALRAAHPDKTIVACECRHICDFNGEYEHTRETNGRVWDGLCGARCKPGAGDGSLPGCACEHPCDG